MSAVSYIETAKYVSPHPPLTSAVIALHYHICPPIEPWYDQGFIPLKQKNKKQGTRQSPCHPRQQTSNETLGLYWLYMVPWLYAGNAWANPSHLNDMAVQIDFKAFSLQGWRGIPVNTDWETQTNRVPTIAVSGTQSCFIQILFDFIAISLALRRPALWWRNSPECPEETKDHRYVVVRPSHVRWTRSKDKSKINVMTKRHFEYFWASEWRISLVTWPLCMYHSR